VGLNVKDNARPDLPPLAQYRTLSDYKPSYGDYIIWSGWLTTWHGVVTNYDDEAKELSIIFSGIPFILFTMDQDEQEKEIRKIKLSYIRGSSHGTWAVMQHDYSRNTNIWYI
jgi:hypothetical protein